MDNFKNKVCKVTGHKWKQYNSLQKCPCDHCITNRKPKQANTVPKKPINRVSDKKKEMDKVYAQLRKVFLKKPENQKCPVTGLQTTDVHHMKGRIGKNYLDVSTWIAVSREGHRKIEENPKWAKEMGYSLNRL